MSVTTAAEIISKYEKNTLSVVTTTALESIVASAKKHESTVPSPLALSKMKLHAWHVIETLYDIKYLDKTFIRSKAHIASISGQRLVQYIDIPAECIGLLHVPEVAFKNLEDQNSHSSDETAPTPTSDHNPHI